MLFRNLQLLNSNLIYIKNHQFSEAFFSISSVVTCWMVPGQGRRSNGDPRRSRRVWSSHPGAVHQTSHPVLSRGTVRLILSSVLCEKEKASMSLQYHSHMILQLLLKYFFHSSRWRRWSRDGILVDDISFHDDRLQANVNSTPRFASKRCHLSAG